MARTGVDFAWAHPPLPAGCSFVGRYLSNDPTKNITASETAWLQSAGQDIFVVWETTTNEVDGGANAGAVAASRALAQTQAANLSGTPIYFGVDYDAVVGPIIRSYFTATRDAIGLARNGAYGGYRVIRDLFDAGIITYGWQTSAWSWYASRKPDPLQQGASGALVAEIQAHLGIKEDGEFGPVTYKAIQQFQEDHNLKTDGIVGNVTGPILTVTVWDPRAQLQQYAYNAVFDWDRAMAADFGQFRGQGPAPIPVDATPGSRIIKQGDTGPDVAELQRCLGLGTDGDFGALTDAAVRQFQSDEGLSVDGVVGPTTWIALVYGSIGDKFRALDGSKGYLGKPLGLEQGVPDGQGRHVEFEGGSIYWHPATGAYSIVGAIRGYWGTLGWETSYLGYPTSDEEDAEITDGRVNRFQYGSIYFSAATGAHSLHGVIGDAWISGLKDTLGFPLTDEMGITDGIGRFQVFPNGTVYWTPTTGAFSVTDPVLAAWSKIGREGSVTGYPISEVVDDGANAVQTFQNVDIVTEPGKAYLHKEIPLG